MLSGVAWNSDFSAMNKHRLTRPSGLKFANVSMVMPLSSMLHIDEAVNVSQMTRYTARSWC
jgi:hypothetical protein